MKKLVIILLLFGCSQSSSSESSKPKRVYREYLTNEVSIWTVDGHEYISINRSITHKENCKNSSHKVK